MPQKKKLESYVAFLRGINVGGHKIIPKQTLIETFEACGFGSVRTFIQSGNVLFESSETDAERLRIKVEQELLKTTGHKIPVMLRTRAEMAALVKSDPFGARKAEPKAYTYVLFLAAKPAAAAKKALLARGSESDHVEIRDTETIHLIFKETGDQTPKSVDFAGRDLGVQITSRNWNTVQKISALMEPDGPGSAKVTGSR